MQMGRRSMMSLAEIFVAAVKVCLCCVALVLACSFLLRSPAQAPQTTNADSVAVKQNRLSPALRGANKVEEKKRVVIFVVLGNMPLNDETPTVDTMTRVRTAVARYKELSDSERGYLVFSGGPTVDKKTEAAMMGDYARTLGVNDKDIILETKARTTKENAIFSAQLLLEMGIVANELFIVSKFDHLDWAVPLFKQSDVPGHYFEKAKPLGCKVAVTESIAQMEEFLKSHPQNKMAAHRLKDLRNGVRGID